MFAGEQRPGSPGSPRNGSGSAEDDDDDDASRHSSEGLNEEDDDAFDAFDDDADDENPRKGTRPKVPWGPGYIAPNIGYMPLIHSVSFSFFSKKNIKIFRGVGMEAWGCLCESAVH